MAQDLKKAVKDIQKIQKSLDAQLDHAEKSVEQSKDELAAQEEANKHVADVKVSDENEKVAKKDKDTDKADEAEKCGGDVEESAKSVKKDAADDGDEEATGSEEEKSVKKDDGDATGDTDVAENSEKPAKDNVKKDTDGKVEETKAKQAKDLNNVEDVKGHEQASKAIVQAIDVLNKAIDTMAETNKSYGVLLNDLDTIIKSYRPAQAEEVEKSAVKSAKKDSEGATDSESTTEKCGDEVAESAKAKKSEKAEKCDDKEEKCDSDDKEEKCDAEAPKAKKSVEETEDQAEKSMPVGQAVYSEDDHAEKSVKESPAEDAVSAGDLKNALRKSITAFSGSELPENMVKVNAMKSLYHSVENMDDKETVKKSMVDEYNRI